MNDPLTNHLGTLLADAVADVEPHDRLAEIRAEVDRAATRRRTSWVVGGGAALAVAASVAVVAVTSSPRGSHAVPPQPAASGTPRASSAPPSVPPVPGGYAFAVYFVGGPPEAPVLYREFHSTPSDALLTAAMDAAMASPEDPDYRSDWAPGDLGDAAVVNGVITIEVTNPGVRTRPASMSDAEAGASVQQLVYTAQAAVQQRLPVQFTYAGNPIDQVLGVPTSEPIVNAPVLQTLSRASLTTPTEGQQVTGSLEVEGVANSYEANVLWMLEDQSGNVVDQGNFTAQGWMAEKLFPFQGSVDVSSLDPGTYTFIVRTDDPSGGAEGFGVSEDTRTVVIE